jgi:hypothetical protein
MTEPVKIHSVMTGFMREMPDGGITASLDDPFGFITQINGIADPLQPGRWILTATVVVPPGLKIAFLDDEVGP